MGYGDMRANKLRMHTKIINSGSGEVNSMELLLYGEQSLGYDGDRGWVLIQSADTGMDAQGARWGCQPQVPKWGQCPGVRSAFSPGFNRLSKVSEGQVR